MSTQQIEGTPLKLTIHNAGFWQVTIDSPPLNLFGPGLLTGLEEVVKRMQSSPFIPKSAPIAVRHPTLPSFLFGRMPFAWQGGSRTRIYF